MDSETTMMMSGAVVVLCQILKGVGASGKVALILATVLSAGATALVAYAKGDYSRVTAIGYGIGWVNVLAAAAGVFNLINSTPEALGTITGGVKGAAANLMNSLKGTPKE